MKGRCSEFCLCGSSPDGYRPLPPPGLRWTCELFPELLALLARDRAHGEGAANAATRRGKTGARVRWSGADWVVVLPAALRVLSFGCGTRGGCLPWDNRRAAWRVVRRCT